MMVMMLIMLLPMMLRSGRRNKGDDDNYDGGDNAEKEQDEQDAHSANHKAKIRTTGRTPNHNDKDNIAIDNTDTRATRNSHGGLIIVIVTVLAAAIAMTIHIATTLAIL